MPQEPIQRGDVYWITYAVPHEKASSMVNEDEIQKQRPILILQNVEDNRSSHYPLVLAAPITTQKTERVYAQDVLLPTGEANLQRTSKVLLGSDTALPESAPWATIGHSLACQNARG